MKSLASYSNKKTIAPSLLSADFWRIGEQIKDLETSGTEWLHLDVMDGHFVPNLTFGPVFVESIRKNTKSLLDCHLMVSEPGRWVEPFAKAGADMITVHCEATHHLHRLLDAIKKSGCLAGVSINPATPLSLVEEIINEVDLILIMSVNPGFGGQSFIESSLQKIQKLRAYRYSNHRPILQIDGGISKQNIKICADAGVDVFVAGSAVFGKKSPGQGFVELCKALET